MGYMVLSCFQMDPQSEVKWKKCFTHRKYNKCVTYCKEKKASGSLAEYYIYPEGEYPIGYLIYYKMLGDYKPLFHC
jgi:hypothetical protein